MDKYQFLIETSHHCFLCLRRVPPSAPDVDASPTSTSSPLRREDNDNDLVTENGNTDPTRESLSEEPLVNVGDVEPAEVKPEPVESDIPHVNVTAPPAHFEVAEEKHTSVEERSSIQAGEPKYTIECDLCQKQFQSRQGYRVHYDAIHLNIRFSCTCGKSFTDRASYNRHHQHAHLGITFTCEHCGKTFNFKGNLYQHQKSVHGGHIPKVTKRFPGRNPPTNNDNQVNNGPASPADFSFEPSSSSSAPEPTASRSRPPNQKGRIGPSSPRSKQCDQQFKTNKGLLSRHVTLVHSPNQNHNQDGPGSEGGKVECEFCRKQFASSSGLRLHTVAFHLGQRYQCSYCPQLFSQISSRNLHMRRRCPQRLKECPDQ